MGFLKSLWDDFVKIVYTSKPIVLPPPPVVMASDKDEEKLKKLHPKVASMLRTTIVKARASGLNVALFSGLRSIEEQDKLYAIGRDPQGNVIDMKAIVTNAKGGQSYHNYGVAGDIVFKDEKGNWTWEVKDELWTKLGNIGQNASLYWGGKFHMDDEDHFQYIMGLSKLSELRKLYDKGGLQEVWALLD